MDISELADTRLTADEETDLGLLEDKGSDRTDEESTRYWDLLLRKCPPATPAQERAHYERLQQQGIDFDAAYRAFNNGDHGHVERFLQAVAPPPRDMVEALERRINHALKRFRVPSLASPVTNWSRPVQRPRERRAASRARARSPGSSDDGPEPPRPLTGRERSSLKQLRDRAVREWLATVKECQSCYLDLPRDAFRPARNVCMECETETRIERRHANAVAT